ncbi:MAG: hypothetical protein JNK79_20205 [Chitinophagaceae bacterium]|nr:hypothetical protein [Chitinophagaceae bacterium]
MRTYTNLFKNKLIVLATFTGAALIIFAPSTGRIFLSDDYCTLHNVVENNSIWLETFFRPIGDLTLMWSYKLTGWNPFYFYLTNIILHAVNSFLLYVFCLEWFGRESRYVFFAVAAGLIFLTYPSHSEPILWAIGRGVSLAVFFSLLAMITVIGNIRTDVKYILAGLLYFIALACYESVLLLPVILCFLSQRTSRKFAIRMAIVLTAALFLHLLLRYYLTGGIWRAYNGVIFTKDLIQYLTTFSKILLRLFIPPFDYPLFFTLCGVVVYAILTVVLYNNRKRFESDRLFTNTLLLVVTGLLSTILVALSFGLSTRTSEGDRLMYFPSVFYSILLSFLTVRLIYTLRWSLLAVVLIVVVQSAFLVINQGNWNRASEMAAKVLNGVARHPQRPLYIINMPSDYYGAYVFRNCLPEALSHYGMDTSGVRIVNILRSAEMEIRKIPIAPETKGVRTFIWPETLLEVRRDSVISMTLGSDSAIAVNVPASSFLYWNNNDLVPLMKTSAVPAPQ